MEATILAIVDLFTDLGLVTYVGVGVVIGGAAWIFGKVAKAGR